MLHSINSHILATDCYYHVGLTAFENETETRLGTRLQHGLVVGVSRRDHVMPMWAWGLHWHPVLFHVQVKMLAIPFVIWEYRVPP